MSNFELALIEKMNTGKGARRTKIIKCCGKKSCDNILTRSRSTNATKSAMLVTNPTLKVKTITNSFVEKIKDTSNAQYDTTVFTAKSTVPLSDSEQSTSVTTTGRVGASVATEDEPSTEKSQTGN